MTKTIFQHNVENYSAKGENDYIKQWGHQLRLRISEDFISTYVKEKKLVKPRILSIGPALGHFEGSLIKKYNAVVDGIDGTPESVKYSKENGLNCVIGNFEDPLPFADNLYDIVFAGESIEHLMDVKVFLSEVHRVLKPGGIFVLTTPNLARLDDRIKFLFGYSPRHVAPMHKYLFLHIRPFTWHSLKEALTIKGFVDIKLRSNFVEFYPRRRFQSEFLAKFFPSLGATLIVKAQKPL